MKDDFGGMLRGFRERNGRSRNALAHHIGVDPSYLTRVENGHREPPRPHIVDAMSRALRLNGLERSQFMVAAGYIPVVVSQIGTWDTTLQDVSDVLNDLDLSPEEKGEFKHVIHLICQRWHANPSEEVIPIPVWIAK